MKQNELRAFRDTCWNHSHSHSLSLQPERNSRIESLVSTKTFLGVRITHVLLSMGLHIPRNQNLPVVHIFLFLCKFRLFEEEALGSKSLCQPSSVWKQHKRWGLCASSFKGNTPFLITQALPEEARVIKYAFLFSPVGHRMRSIWSYRIGTPNAKYLIVLSFKITQQIRERATIRSQNSLKTALIVKQTTHRTQVDF